MQEKFDIDQEIKNIETVMKELTGRLKFLLALIDGGYEIVKQAQPDESEDKE